jgi:hypothetical protein
MGNVGPWVFDEILRGIPAGAEWQVRIGQRDGRDVVNLRLEGDAARAAEIDAAVRANLRDRFSDFWKNLGMKLYELRVSVEPIGSLRGSDRKLRRIVDERTMS